MITITITCNRDGEIDDAVRLKNIIKDLAVRTFDAREVPYKIETKIDTNVVG